MTQEEIASTRLKLQDEFGKLLGVKYKFGAEWTDYSKLPEFIDCSESVEGVCHKSGLEAWDGSQNQFDHMKPIDKRDIGNFAFFGHGKDTSKIYHVGMIYDANNIIEARALDAAAHFKTGEVILRPIEKWVNWKDFVGFRVHPQLV